MTIPKIPILVAMLVAFAGKAADAASYTEVFSFAGSGLYPFADYDGRYGLLQGASFSSVIVAEDDLIALSGTPLYNSPHTVTASFTFSYFGFSVTDTQTQQVVSPAVSIGPVTLSDTISGMFPANLLSALSRGADPDYYQLSVSVSSEDLDVGAAPPRITSQATSFTFSSVPLSPTSVPEPGSFALLGLGTIGFAFARVRQLRRPGMP